LKLIHTSEDRVYLFHLKNILEAQDIECVIKNDRLSSLSGEIPMLTVWPELWVKDALKEKWAKEIITNFEKQGVEGVSWTCENCGETHGAQFKDCWNCQSSKAF